MLAVHVGDIADLVRELTTLSRTDALRYSIEVGRLVVERVFGGESHAVRRRGRKAVSFRMLARHPDLPLSSTSLWRCVALYELCRRLPFASTSKHLGAAHLRAVLALPSEQQRELLELAEAERWTAEYLLRVAGKRQRELAPSPAADGEIRRAARTFLSVAASESPPCACSAPEALLTPLRTNLREARARIEEWEAALETWSVEELTTDAVSPRGDETDDVAEARRRSAEMRPD